MIFAHFMATRYWIVYARFDNDGGTYTRIETIQATSLRHAELLIKEQLKQLETNGRTCKLYTLVDAVKGR